MKVTDRVEVSDTHYYNGFGYIVAETKCFWIVDVLVHYTMGELYGNQKKVRTYFWKKNCLSLGYSKHVNTTGDFYSVCKLTDERFELFELGLTKLTHNIYDIQEKC